MAEDNVKNKATSIESATDVSASSSSGISSTPVTSANVDIKTSTVSSNIASSSVPISTVQVNATKSEVKYPIDELIKNSKALTGHKREVAVGALFNCQEKELTKDDFKKALDVFLKRKVK